MLGIFKIVWTWKLGEVLVRSTLDHFRLLGRFFEVEFSSLGLIFKSAFWSMFNEAAKQHEARSWGIVCLDLCQNQFGIQNRLVYGIGVIRVF